MILQFNMEMNLKLCREMGQAMIGSLCKTQHEHFIILKNEKC